MKKRKPGKEAPSPCRDERPAPAGGPFAPGKETTVAMVLLARWFPPLITRFEAGVREMGLEITRRVMERCTDGTVVPVIHVRKKDSDDRLVLKLRNALDEFLCVDRTAKPVQVDARLTDEVYAEQKLAAVLNVRLGIVRAIVESRTPEELQGRVEALARDCDTLRMLRIERPEGAAPGEPGAVL
ncbi:MAG TPA: hypothetical protein PKY77_22075 [Phycisphaerae bacterium]|nr:hypothetical protein [Phycisphaerae bacterium]